MTCYQVTYNGGKYGLEKVCWWFWAGTHKAWAVLFKNAISISYKRGKKSKAWDILGNNKHILHLCDFVIFLLCSRRSFSPCVTIEERKLAVGWHPCQKPQLWKKDTVLYPLGSIIKSWARNFVVAGALCLFNSLTQYGSDF